SCCGTEPETTGAVPQHESATSDGKRVSNHYQKKTRIGRNSPEGKRVFEASFSTPTRHITHNRGSECKRLIKTVKRLKLTAIGHFRCKRQASYEPYSRACMGSLRHIRFARTRGRARVGIVPTMSNGCTRSRFVSSTQTTGDSTPVMHFSYGAKW